MVSGTTFRSSGWGGDLSWGRAVATKRGVRERWRCSHLQRLGQCPCLGQADAQLPCTFWDIAPPSPLPSRRHSEPRQSVRAGVVGGGGEPEAAAAALKSRRKVQAQDRIL